MTIAVILVLGVLWVAVLLPPILRARGQQSRTDSVGDFHYKLSSLGRANGHRTRPSRSSTSPIFVPPSTGSVSMSPTQKRRRDVLFVLLGVAAATLFLAALTRSTAFLALQLLSDIALGGYVYLLIQYKNRTQGQRTSTKVRYLGAGYSESMFYGNGQYGSASRDAGAPRLVPLRQTASR